MNEQIVESPETPEAGGCCGPAEGDLRQRGQRRRDREAAIVAAAIDEFRTAGLPNARLDDIAAKAGVAKGTLYLYFDSKEELFKAAVRSLIHPLLEAVEQQVAVFEGPTEDLLRHAIRTMYANSAAQAGGCELMRLMIAEGHRMADLAEFYRSEVAARGLATLRMIVWRGIAKGEFRQSPAAEFPHLLLAPFKLSTTWQLIFGKDHGLDLERYAEAHVEFALAALKVPVPAGS